MNQQLRSKLNHITNTLWAGGVTNPVTYIEQISYLIFLKLLDEEENDRELRSRLESGKNGHGNAKLLFPKQAERYRWSKWRFKSGNDLRDFIRDEVFPYMASLAKDEPEVAEYFRDAVLEIVDPNVLKEVIDDIDGFEFRKLGPDVKGDIFEYLLTHLGSSALNGQFRTPRQVRAFMVEMTDPDVGDSLFDPACGTAGFLIDAVDYLLAKYSDHVSEYPIYGEHEAQLGREKRSLARLDVHHTDIGGSSIDLGGFRQFVHRRQLNRRVEWGVELNVSALVADKDQRLMQLLAPVKILALNIALGMELDNEDRAKPGAEPRVESVELLADGAELLRMSRRRTDAQGNTLRLDRLASDHPVFRLVLKAIVESATTTEEMRPEDFAGANEAINALLPELLVRIDSFFPVGIDLSKSGDTEPSQPRMLFPVSRGNRAEDIGQAVRFYIPRTLNDLIKGISEVFAAELKQLQYLGPLRSFPPRHLAFAEHEDANWYAGGGYAQGNCIK